MRRVAFYITDHGFGHATRCIALIRALLACSDIGVLVRAGSKGPFLAASLAEWTARGRVRILPGPTNAGLITRPGSMDVDRALTAETAAAEVAGLPAWIDREVALCRGESVSLVVSDIVPGAFIVAARLGIRGLAVTNFTWFDVYADLFPDAVWLQPLREAYEQADEAAVLPFTSGVTAFKKVWEAPLLARRADPHRARRIRAGVGNPGAPVIYVGLGGSFPDMHRVAGHVFSGSGGLPPGSVLGPAPGPVSTPASFIVGRGLGGAFPGALEIPTTDPEGQDYLAAADVAVVKAGYSSVAEAVLARVPLVILCRPDVAEDRDIAAEAERLGIGVGIFVMDGRIDGDLGQAIERALMIGAAYPAQFEPYLPGDSRI